MKKRGKLLIAFMLITFSLFGQVLTASASVVGVVQKVTTSSLSMRTGPGTGYGIIMTMANGEAVADQGESVPNNGYNWGRFLGWKSSIGSTVSGYAAREYLTHVWAADAKWDLNIYATDTTESWSTCIPAGSTGLHQWNGGGSQVIAYNNLRRIGVDEYVAPGGSYRAIPLIYVNSYFQSSSPSGYSLVLH